MSDIDYNEGIRDVVEEQLKKEEQARADAIYLSLCAKDVMGMKSGRHFVWNLLVEYKVFQDGFHQDPIILARNTGIRGAGLLLYKLILAECPEQNEIMFAEHRYIEEENE